MQLIFASTNRGKLKEIEKLFDYYEFRILSLADFDNYPEIVESGTTFFENAKLKAEKTFNHFRIPVIADDSGLCVEQLNGAPGVISARYAGEKSNDKKNIERLLSELKKFETPHKASFFCSAVFYDGQILLSAEGEVKGKIIEEEKGSNGFGYDPVFIPDGFTQTMAEISPEIKNKISHRAKAFNDLKSLIINYWRNK
ncbi:MAG: RdgB/HAM1 family non-canonical purine NTP pyrophosphatase [Ignavibacteriaceae bacterium]|nr:RdgB/HAM1 family non-canonical purine NTP pyrophosphatase [Ignavibacteriaceae bacterium]